MPFLLKFNEILNLIANNILVIFLLLLVVWYFLKDKIRLGSYKKSVISGLLPISLLVLFGFYSKVEVQGWSIIIVIIIFLIDYINKDREAWQKQEEILKLLYFEIDHILKDKGHMNYFRSCLPKNCYPHHNLTKFNADFYVKELRNEINSKPTLELKEKLKRLNDKVDMLNDYRKDSRTWRLMVEKYIGGGYVEKLLEEIENQLKELQQIILNLQK